MLCQRKVHITLRNNKDNKLKKLNKREEALTNSIRTLVSNGQLITFTEVKQAFEEHGVNTISAPDKASQLTNYTFYTLANKTRPDQAQAPAASAVGEVDSNPIKVQETIRKHEERLSGNSMFSAEEGQGEAPKPRHGQS